MVDCAQMLIAGEWCGGGAGTADVLNPATGAVIGAVAMADRADLDRALDAAAAAFVTWSRVSAYERSAILRKAADLLRSRAEAIGRLMTSEQGKPFPEAKGEVMGSADHIDWAAEEGRRIYGRVIPSRAPNVSQISHRVPLGVVAGFSPWNFPVSQAVRKIAGALGAGCPIIVKCPEETPFSCVELVRCFADAGVPAGVVNLVYGVPADISEYLIPAAPVRMITFTGSIPVGKHLGELAARHVKRCTLELGGHSPFIVAEDANVDAALALAVGLKFRNAGQVCASPSRFMVHERHYERFVDGFVKGAEALKVGEGFADGVQMGPLANARRLEAMEAFVADAAARGATVRTGGRRIGNEGYFYAPTVLTDVPDDARLMVEEPFGPVAPIAPFSSLETAIEKANQLPFALAAFAFGSSQHTVSQLADGLEAGMVSINHFGIASPETPFGGMKESGYGSEGGVEGMEAFVTTKFVSTATLAA
ncbi:NAD-dependent succinate-semialdehyde dehydrogenase [Martelella radicis]|uniref:Succinate-semialdehyde dehydrogenase/glutarate-semialdehyde dehydrogenase n=1 Tax=Martelella radicis TaxID=1397476 RepID=A0A7W6PA54_9HYPH|nr:NAD-dependent succinate-semialdehyde dehydrogenase [Martelella radicis]MBB4122051.1 succinate-semialdehyde dehydrogenase/glutarate-semialdehyde dehydrogenase [Martelella radicis]